MNYFSFRIISAGQGVGSCLLSEIPDNYIDKLMEMNADLNTLTCFYFKERDYIILNEEHKHFLHYRDLTIAYMSLNEDNRMEVLKHVCNSSVYHFLILLEGVIRHRESMRNGNG